MPWPTFGLFYISDKRKVHRKSFHAHNLPSNSLLISFKHGTSLKSLDNAVTYLLVKKSWKLFLQCYPFQANNKQMLTVARYYRSSLIGKTELTLWDVCLRGRAYLPLLIVLFVFSAFLCFVWRMYVRFCTCVLFCLVFVCIFSCEFLNTCTHFLFNTCHAIYSIHFEVFEVLLL